MKTLKYLLVDVAKHKEIVHQLYFIGELLQTKVKNRVFVNFDSRYADSSRMFKLLWNSLDIIEFHVWYDQLWEVV